MAEVTFRPNLMGFSGFMTLLKLLIDRRVAQARVAHQGVIAIINDGYNGLTVERLHNR